MVHLAHRKVRRTVESARLRSRVVACFVRARAECLRAAWGLLLPSAPVLLSLRPFRSAVPVDVMLGPIALVMFCSIRLRRRRSLLSARSDFLRIAQGLVRPLNFLEDPFCRFVARVLVGMVPLNQTQIRCPDVNLRRAAVQAQHLVRIGDSGGICSYREQGAGIGLTAGL